MENIGWYVGIPSTILLLLAWLWLLAKAITDIERGGFQQPAPQPRQRMMEMYFDA